MKQMNVNSSYRTRTLLAAITLAMSAVAKQTTNKPAKFVVILSDNQSWVEFRAVSSTLKGAGTGQRPLVAPCCRADRVAITTQNARPDGHAVELRIP